MSAAIDKAIARFAGNDAYDNRSKVVPGHEQRLAALVAREERRRTRLDKLSDLRKRGRRRHRSRHARKTVRPKPTPRPMTLKLSRRRDGRWQKKIAGRLVYFGGRGTTEDEARQSLVAYVKMLAKN